MEGKGLMSDPHSEAGESPRAGDRSRSRRGIRLVGRYVLMMLTGMGYAIHGYIFMPAANGVFVLPPSGDGPEERPECASLTAAEQRAWARITAELE